MPAPRGPRAIKPRSKRGDAIWRASRTPRIHSPRTHGWLQHHFPSRLLCPQLAAVATCPCRLHIRRAAHAGSRRHILATPMSPPSASQPSNGLSHRTVIGWLLDLSEAPRGRMSASSFNHTGPSAQGRLLRAPFRLGSRGRFPPRQRGQRRQRVFRGPRGTLASRNPALRRRARRDPVPCPYRCAAARGLTRGREPLHRNLARLPRLRLRAPHPLRRRASRGTGGAGRPAASQGAGRGAADSCAWRAPPPPTLLPTTHPTVLSLRGKARAVAGGRDAPRAPRAAL